MVSKISQFLAIIFVFFALLLGYGIYVNPPAVWVLAVLAPFAVFIWAAAKYGMKKHDDSEASIIRAMEGFAGRHGFEINKNGGLSSILIRGKLKELEIDFYIFENSEKHWKSADYFYYLAVSLAPVFCSNFGFAAKSARKRFRINPYGYSLLFSSDSGGQVVPSDAPEITSGKLQVLRGIAEECGLAGVECRDGRLYAAAEALLFPRHSTDFRERASPGQVSEKLERLLFAAEKMAHEFKGDSNDNHPDRASL